MERIKVTQIKSAIKRPRNQKLTLEALGLGRIGKTVEHNAEKSILGMVDTVRHLVTVEEIKN